MYAITLYKYTNFLCKYKKKTKEYYPSSLVSRLNGLDKQLKYQLAH